MANSSKSSLLVGKNNAFDVFLYIAFTTFALSVLYPFWDLLVRSFSAPVQSTKLGFMFFPEKLSLASYAAVFSSGNILRSYANTIFRTVVGTGLGLLVNTCAAYALSKKKLPFRTGITAFFVFTMFFNGGLIPSYFLMKNIGLIDSIWALILPCITGVFNIIIIRNYISSIDPALEEVAQIDGANQYTILFRIFLPICKPILATVALWTMVGHWNAWFDAMLYTNKPNLMVLQLVLRNILIAKDGGEFTKMVVLSGYDSQFTTESIKAAFIFVIITPILCSYPFLQKYFVKGIMIGSLKG